MKLDIQHDTKKHCFYVNFDNTQCALKYDVAEEGVLNFRSTYVPEAYRQQGIAGKIVKEGLEYAKANNYKIIPSCSFVKAFIKRHPEYAELIKIPAPRGGDFYL